MKTLAISHYDELFCFQDGRMLKKPFMEAQQEIKTYLDPNKTSSCKKWPLVRIQNRIEVIQW
jgi:hypothetical protein